ncbi:MAG: hypothetical protein EP329_07005 [Deltaproteobacteria bacterium]|nr:MAG: hypothetical protein EP329_07005 [Deltaproteobacteria bacterium]
MTTEPQNVPTFELDAVREHLAATDAELLVYIDETHMSYLPTYLVRADAMHVLGAPPEQVLRQLWLAARCYATNGEVYLAKWPVHQFRRRRLLPLELAITVADGEVLTAAKKHFIVDPMTLLAGAEPDVVTEEVGALTRFFRGGDISDQADLTGFLAVTYWMVLGAIASADNEALEMVRALTARILEKNLWLARKRVGGLGRMLCAHQVIGELRPAVPDGIVDAIAEHGRLHGEALAARLADDEAVRKTGEGALDVTSMALLAMASAAGIDLGERLAARKEEPELAQALAYAPLLGHTAVA